ncbi:MAG: serine/threonine protein kinase [Planctomycetota bacterium]|jgi:serine/threonine protein kinase
MPADSYDSIAEQFLAARRLGENPSIEDLARQHPELAEEILETFPVLGMLESAGEHMSVTDYDQDGLKELGDYQVQGVLGRGGMGVVYRARQRSLERNVALKILSRSARLDPQHLERFRREALAAARLRHPGIVPVFDVGEIDGVPYYAMQLIDGVGLDEIIRSQRESVGKDDSSKGSGEQGTGKRGKPSHAKRGSEADKRWNPAAREASDSESVLAPSPDVAGQMAEQLRSRIGSSVERQLRSDDSSVINAAALNDSRTSTRSSTARSRHGDHWYRNAAHLIARAAHALAHAHAEGVLHRDLKPSNLLLDRSGQIWIADFGLAKYEGSKELTHSGDVLGTPNYLAPESLRGWSDTRTDIWGLGVTLYELATLHAPYDAPNRASLLRTIAETSPERPRRVDTRIPIDLETIVMHATEHAPERRYQSAEELAEDLERYLAGKPVLARRAPLSHRAGLFLRRHRVGASTSLVALLLFAGLSIFSALRVKDASKREQGALQDARDQTALAHENFTMALDAVKRMQLRLGAEELADLPRIEMVRHEMLEETVEFYRRFMSMKADDPKLKREAARAWSRLGWLELGFEDHDEAEKNLLIAESMLMELIGTASEDRGELALVRVNIGRVLFNQARFAEAEEFIDKGLQLFDELSQVDRLNRRLVAPFAMTLAASGRILLQTHRSKEAVARFEYAIELVDNCIYEPSMSGQASPEMSLRQAQARSGMGRGLMNLGRFEEAQEQLLIAQNHFAGIKGRDYLSDWMAAQANGALAGTILRTGRVDEALTLFHGALEEYERLVEDRPSITMFKESLAYARVDIGLALLEVVRLDEAESELEKAIKVFDDLLTSERFSFARNRQLAVAWTAMGNLYFARGQLPEAGKAFRRSIEELEELRASVPSFYESELAVGDLALALGNLGNILNQQEEPGEAEACLMRALAMFDELIKRSPGRVHHHEQITLVVANLARGLRHHGRASDAPELLAPYRAKVRQWLLEFPGSDTLRQNVASLARISGNIFKDLELIDQGMEELRFEIEVREELVERLKSSARYRSLLGGARNDLALMLMQRLDYELAIEQLEMAIEDQRGALEKYPDDRQFLRHMVLHHINLSNSLDALGEKERAAVFAEGAAEFAGDDARMLYYSATRLMSVAKGANEEQFKEWAKIAIELVEEAKARGAVKVEEIRQSEALMPLHGIPEFDALLKE